MTEQKWSLFKLTALTKVTCCSFLGSLLLLFGCNTSDKVPLGKLSVGVVSYDEGVEMIDQYEEFKSYLATQTQTIVELEPSYNELLALDQIREQRWSLVFAPPGLAAIAIDEAQYIPIVPLVSNGQLRSIILVLADSPIEDLGDLAGKTIALGSVGSALSYYLPLYNLYGITLAEVRFAQTPKQSLEWLEQAQVDAIALGEQQYEQYKNLSSDGFRVLHYSRTIPPGSILISPQVDRNQEAVIRQALNMATPDLSAAVGYLSSENAPDYTQLIEIIKKVKPLEERVRQKPAVLTLESE